MIKMADFYVTADGGSFSEIDPVAKAIKAEGFSVETGSRGPDAEALRNNGTVKPPTKLVFICNGGLAGQTYGSFALDYSDGMCFTIFAFDNYRTHFSTTNEDALKNKKLVSEWDSGSFATDAIAKDIEGHTTCSYQQKYSDVFAFVTSETSAEDLGKKIANGQYTCGSGDGAGTGNIVGSGGGAQIKDKTFEKCIRRICAATDSIFIVENNVAVLFPYTDWLAFTLREKISTISAKEIDPNVFSTDYTTEGFYNKVTIAWGGAQLPERFPNNPIMHEAYMQKKQTQTKEGKSNTTTTITTNTDGTTLISEQYDALVEKYGELEKRVESPVADLETAQYLVNALLIQYVRDFNNACQCRSLANRKYIGGTFYVVTNPFTKEQEMQYLNGYTTRTQKGQPIYFDLDFRYGPESAEELLDYQTYSGGAAASGGGGTTGDPSTEQAIWDHASKFCHFWSCPELREAESDTNDPQVAVDYVKQKEAANTPKICLSCYGMSAWLYYYFNYKANIPCRVIFGGGHKVVELYKNNAWYKPIEEYRQLDEGFRYNDECKSANCEVTLEAPGGPK